MEIKSSTKFLSLMIIHNFNVHFFYLGHRVLGGTFLVVGGSRWGGLCSPRGFWVSRAGWALFRLEGWVAFRLAGGMRGLLG